MATALSLVPAETLAVTERERLTALEATITRGLTTFVEVGTALVEIRDARLYRESHETFEAYCRERWSLSRPRAYQLMEAAAVAADLSTVVDIAPTSERQARPLTRVVPEHRAAVWQEVVNAAPRDAAGDPKITASFVEDVVDRLIEQAPEVVLRAARDIRAKKADENREARAELASRPVAVPAGTYSCIVIDPPWPIEKIARDERPNQVGLDYPTMTEDELRAFPVPDFAADDCHLYLWTTHKYLPMAFRLAEHWGFNYQCLMTWVKNVGFTPFSWMYSTEHVLFCRRGSLPLAQLGRRLDFTGKVREHSRKPDEFYELVRECSPGPRIDVFSREPREGFAQMGNEPERFA